jgi:hypothetical protein
LVDFQQQRLRVLHAFDHDQGRGRLVAVGLDRSGDAADADLGGCPRQATVLTGATRTLAVAATGSPLPTYQWRKDGGQFIPNPATWLNQGRWDDQGPEVREQTYEERCKELGVLP